MFGRPLSMAHLQEDVVSDEGSDPGSISGSDELAESLHQLRHNFKQLVQQKEAMQSYCDEMQDTVEQKEALVSKLHRKLRQVRTKGGPSAGSDSESENDRGWSGEQVRRRRMLPSVPGRSSRRAQQYSDSSLEELIDRIGELETECEKLRKQAKEASIYAEEQESIAQRNSMLLDQRPHSGIGSSLGVEITHDEFVSAKVKWEKDMKSLAKELKDALDANTALKDLLDENTAELEHTERELAQFKRANHLNAGPSPDLSTELSESLYDSLASEAQPIVIEPVAKSKGMTYAEQATILEEKWRLTNKLHDVSVELTDVKAKIALNEYEREMETVFMRNRDRILIKILSRRLSSADRERVIQMLKTTGHDAAGRLATEAPDPKSPLGKRRLIISPPVAGSFRKVSPSQAMQDQMNGLKGVPTEVPQGPPPTGPPPAATKETGESPTNEELPSSSSQASESKGPPES